MIIWQSCWDLHGFPNLHTIFLAKANVLYYSFSDKYALLKLLSSRALISNLNYGSSSIGTSSTLVLLGLVKMLKDLSMFLKSVIGILSFRQCIIIVLINYNSCTSHSLGRTIYPCFWCCVYKFFKCSIISAMIVKLQSHVGSRISDNGSLIICFTQTLITLKIFYLGQ